jgi:hypothetical protein
MGFLDFLKNASGIGLIQKAFSGKDKNPDGTDKNDIYAEIKSLLGTYTGNAKNDYIKGIGLNFEKTGKESITGGLGGLNEVQDFYQSIMSGDVGLDYFNSPELTQNQDENQRILEEFGVRGGRRAADLSGLQVSRESSLNKAYQNLKQQAPQGLQNVSGQILDYGQQASTLALGAYSDIVDKYLNEFNIELGGRENASDRKAAIINGVLAAAGTAIGFAACVTGDTRVLTSHGYKVFEDLHNEFNKDNTVPIKIKASVEGDRLVSTRIQYIRKTYDKKVYEVRTFDGHKLSCTDNHFIVISLDPYIEKPISQLTLDDKAVLLENGRVYQDNIKSITEIPDLQTVYIIKLGLENDDKNYMFVTDGFLSIDDDLKLKDN